MWVTSLVTELLHHIILWLLLFIIYMTIVLYMHILISHAFSHEVPAVSYRPWGTGREVPAVSAGCEVPAVRYRPWGTGSEVVAVSAGREVPAVRCSRWDTSKQQSIQLQSKTLLIRDMCRTWFDHVCRTFTLVKHLQSKCPNKTYFTIILLNVT